MVQRAGGRTRCELVSLDQVYELGFALSREIRREGFSPEVVVAIARGGFLPARLVCDFLRIPALTSLWIRHYGAGARRRDRARVEYPLAADVRGRRVLIVDDVNDSGETLALAREHVAQRGPADLRIGVLHEKSTSRFAADFRAATVERWHWLVYQWALVEDTLGFLEQMAPEPRTPFEARERLEKEFGLRLSDADWTKVQSSMDGR